MGDTLYHKWDLSPAEARLLQEQLKDQVIEEDQLETVRLIAGIDVGYTDEGGTCRAAAALLSYPGLELVEYATAQLPVNFPYIRGLLSFREVPVALQALGRLKNRPDLLICDGQGRAHYRRLGLACHIGLLSGLPSIGVAKSRLCGQYPDLPLEKGEWVPLCHKGETVGIVLRTRTGKKPLFVSPGHKISLETSRQWVLRCLTKYRLPETTRWAHRIASGNSHSAAAKSE